jgi:hypothetical protein
MRQETCDGPRKLDSGCGWCVLCVSALHTVTGEVRRMATLSVDVQEDARALGIMNDPGEIREVTCAFDLTTIKKQSKTA